PLPVRQLKVLLTNDDGVQAPGLHAMRRALLEIPAIELGVIAPDTNRSATARSITTRRPLWVEEIEFGDGTSGFATDGTPVDCVRFATLGLIEFQLPEETLLNINSPAGEVKGAKVTSLGKRRYNDQLELEEEDDRGRKRYRIYGMEPRYEPQDGSDLTAVHDGFISVTPIHFDLTDVSGMETLSAFDFDRLLRPAAREID